MKRALLLILLFSVTIHLFAQTKIKTYDSVLNRTLQRYILIPEYQKSKQIEALFLWIHKTEDSLKMHSLYSTNMKLNSIVADPHLIYQLNKKCNEIIKDSLSLVIPVYFFFDESNELTKSFQKQLHSKQNQFIKKGFIFSANPIHIIVREPFIEKRIQ